MNDDIVLSRYFLQQAHKFFRKHPELEAEYEDLIADLQRDPFQPHLRLHKLKGKLHGQHAVSLTRTYRITLTLMIAERNGTLIDIGTHDEVYRLRTPLVVGKNHDAPRRHDVQ